MSTAKRRQKPDMLQDESLAQEAARLDAQAIRARVENPLRAGVLNWDPESDLGKRIQQGRQRAGLTQEQLAALTARADKAKGGISAPVISLYERGVNKPGPKELRLLCEALRVSPNFLLYGDEDPFGELTERGRFNGWATTDAEFLAVLTYCFGRLHHHDRSSLMQLMTTLLRGSNKNFAADIDREAVQAFLRTAEELRLLLKQREKVKK